MVSIIEKLPGGATMDGHIVLMHDSYGIICDAERVPPEEACLELLDHPENIIPCTLSEEVADRVDVDSGDSGVEKPFDGGVSNRIRSVQLSVTIGEIKGGEGVVLDVYSSSFSNSLSPSARGCNVPGSPTMFGPRRRCMLLRIFLSKSVG
jgi:hypothetical protein